jgi:hypothetical protein
MVLKIKNFIVLIILVILCYTIKANLNPKKTSNDIIEVNYGENISTIIPIGKIIIIKVRENATTGFFTFIKNFNEISRKEKTIDFYDIKYDDRVNLYKSKEYEIIKNIDGGEGYCVFKIKALKPLNKVEIIFITIKPWEINKKNALSYDTIINISTKELSFLE